MKVVIKIDMELGSKMQKSFAKTSLDIVLAAWQKYLAQSHKKNSVKIEIEYIEQR